MKTLQRIRRSRVWLKLPIFWNWTPKNIPDWQKPVTFRKSRKNTKSLHPTLELVMVCSSEAYWCLPPPITGLVMDHDYCAKNHLLNLLFSSFFFKEVQLRIYDSGKTVILYITLLPSPLGLLSHVTAIHVIQSNIKSAVYITSCFLSSWLFRFGEKSPKIQT